MTENFLEREGITVVDFYAQWCGPCQQMIKILPRLEQAISGKGSIVKVDIDEELYLRSKFKIEKIPTFVLLKNKEEVFRFEGIVPIMKIADKVHELSA